MKEIKYAMSVDAHVDTDFAGLAILKVCTDTTENVGFAPHDQQHQMK